MKMKRLFGAPAQGHINVELLSAFLDGQVSQAERALVESHLSGCALCRDELESLRRTVLLMQALPRVRVPHAFTLSEAMVKGHKPATGASWLGGLARGLGAVAAVALVVVLASTLLRQPMAVPLPPVARSVPTVASPEAAAEMFAAPAAIPEKAAEAQEEPVTAAAAPGQPTAEAPAAPAIAPAVAQPQPTLAPASPTEAAPVARAAAPSATPEPPMLALGVPGATETPAGPARTLAPGENAPGAAALPAQSLTPEPLPPMAAVADVWPDTARLVYADAQALWALDRAEGLRQIAVGQALSSPLISPDGDYVVYSAIQEGRVTLWGLPWRGGKPRLLLDEAQLPKDGLAPQYRERRVQDVSWVPGQRTLALVLMVVPAPATVEAMPKTELWALEVETGTLRQVADMGRAYRPYYAPDGKQFALLAYGTEADPQGRLTLFDADGSNPRVALTFPASPATLSYETQLAWLPDSSALWLAIPAADPLVSGSSEGTKLYLVLASGQAQEIAFLDAQQVAWSPDGALLAYLRITDDETGAGELRLAEADGSNDQPYAAVRAPAFLGWSPDGTYFLYQDSDQIYLGAAGRAPVLLGNAVSLFDPRWVSAREFVSLHDAGDRWLLTLRTVEGKVYGLMPLPREALLDVAHQ